MASRSRRCSGWLIASGVIRPAGAHPFIDLSHLELPQAPHAVRGQVLAVDPAVDGIAFDAQVFGDLFDGYPRLGHGMLQWQAIGWHKIASNRKDSNLTGNLCADHETLGFRVKQRVH